MTFSFRSSIHIYKKDTNFSLSFLRSLINTLESEVSVFVYSEIELPSDIKYTLLENPLEESFYLPIDIRFFFSRIPQKKLNSLSSDSILFEEDSQEFLTKVLKRVQNIKWDRGRLLRSLDLDKSLSISFLAEKLSTGFHSLITDTIRKGFHSRACILDNVDYQFKGSLENLKYCDAVVFYNFIDVSIFDLGKPVVLCIDDLRVMKNMDRNERFYLLKTKLIQKIYTDSTEIKDFFSEFGLDCELLTNTSLSLTGFSKCLASLYTKFNPAVVENLKIDHKFLGEGDTELVIPSDLSKSYAGVLESYDTSYGSQEESWKYSHLAESLRLLGKREALYIGENALFVEDLRAKGYDVLFVFASENLESPDLEEVLEIESLPELTRESHRYVICDSIFDDDDYLSCCSFLWLLRDMGFGFTSISFLRKNNLFLQSNICSQYLQNLGWKINCNGFQSEVPDDKLSIINLIPA